MPAAGDKLCPFLGLREDPSTCMGYPSPWNLCHHCKPVVPVGLTHQKETCLTPAYTGCPVFYRQKIRALPRQLRAQPGRQSQGSLPGRK